MGVRTRNANDDDDDDDDVLSRASSLPRSAMTSCDQSWRDNVMNNVANASSKDNADDDDDDDGICCNSHAQTIDQPKPPNDPLRDA